MLLPRERRESLGECLQELETSADGHIAIKIGARELREELKTIPKDDHTPFVDKLIDFALEAKERQSPPK